MEEDDEEDESSSSEEEEEDPEKLISAKTQAQVRLAGRGRTLQWGRHSCRWCLAEAYPALCCFCWLEPTAGAAPPEPLWSPPLPADL